MELGVSKVGTDSPPSFVARIKAVAQHQGLSQRDTLAIAATLLEDWSRMADFVREVREAEKAKTDLPYIHAV